ncbi:MAG TPA: hypothetical protein PKA63_05430 [Oligoflexia bacterium]|nr:hypothetical protein [Oligoflexia bacterium]HMP48090.1 hypothetical protein [Oligoflexia bacterium]
MSSEFTSEKISLIDAFLMFARTFGFNEESTRILALQLETCGSIRLETVNEAFEKSGLAIKFSICSNRFLQFVNWLLRQDSSDQDKVDLIELHWQIWSFLSDYHECISASGKSSHMAVYSHRLMSEIRKVGRVSSGKRELLTS